MADRFAENLHHLCARERSVADICRRIDINRQQFNRYLSGANRPSAYNLQRICRFFEVQEHEMLLPHDAFVEQVGKRIAERTVDDRLRSVDLTILSAFPGEIRALSRYTGFYHFYFRTPSWPDRVICGVSALRERAGLVFSKAVTRSLDRHDGSRYISKHEGLATMQRDQIFIVEVQSLALDAVVQTVLTPPPRSETALIPGMTFGISNVTREPYAVPIVWRYLGRNVDLREALRSTGLIDPRTANLNPRILQMVEKSGT